MPMGTAAAAKWDGSAACFLAANFEASSAQILQIFQVTSYPVDTGGEGRTFAPQFVLVVPEEMGCGTQL